MNELLRKRARYLLADTLKEPVIIFDKKELLADYNKEAAEKFDLNNAKLNHLTREAFETSILQLTYEQNPSPYINREVVLQKEYAAISYHVTVQRIQSTCKGFIGWVYMFQDTTKQKMMYNALENMSAYDPLTGFYTSRIFANKLAEWNKKPEEYIIAICNIAGLKLINAFYDRKIGDEVIQRMSEEIRDVIPEDALICYSADDSTVIVAKDITEEQMNLYLSIAAGKIKKYGLENVPVFLNYGIARRENTSIAIEEYIKYASMDLLLKKGRDGGEQKRELTKALLENYFRNEYESMGHVNRIMEYASGMADKLKLGEQDRKKLELLCKYHDVGRVRTREEVWGRPAVITRDELDIIKLHSITGYQIISQMELEQDISDLVLFHHENYDGTGYPYGLSAEKIPLLSRIFAIVDSYDIMINDQLYKEAVPENVAFEELQKGAGSQFDPSLVKLFGEYIRERK